MSTPVVLSYGLGVDSTAILLRWLYEPGCRDFDLADLTVVTAMTGDEWPDTGALVETHLLPLLAAHRVRYVQVARKSGSQRDGVQVLGDSRSPVRLYLSGAYTLAEELLTAGTVPQTGGARRCSAKAKGWPLDRVIADITDGRPFRHVLGFEADETTRAARDARHNTALRTGEYPLITWGWGRADCAVYIRDRLGVSWAKSACVYCPFALATRAGQARTLARFSKFPEAGSLALFMEHVAVALNPAQGLIGGARLADLINAVPGQDAVLAELEARLAVQAWAVYEVRRALPRPSVGGGKRVVRSVHAVATGSRAAMRERLDQFADQYHRPVSTVDGHPRVWVRERGTLLPAVEWFFVIAPAVVPDKIGPGFDRAWTAACADQPAQLALPLAA